MINQIQKTILSPVHYTTLAVLLVGMFLVVSCGDDASTENPSQANSQCESSDPSLPTSFLPPFLADDGCNTCTCLGGEVTCTTLDCEPNDPDIVCTPGEEYEKSYACCVCPDSGIRAQSGCIDIEPGQSCDDS